MGEARLHILSDSCPSPHTHSCRCLGGTLVGTVGLTVNLILWTVIAVQARPGDLPSPHHPTKGDLSPPIAVQTVSQAAPPSAAALPPFVKALFTRLEVFQLQGLVLPPACTGEAVGCGGGGNL